jgi:hypothetical protein
MIISPYMWLSSVSEIQSTVAAEATCVRTTFVKAAAVQARVASIRVAARGATVVVPSKRAGMRASFGVRL